MIELRLVGIAAGNPAHLTREAVAALSGADLILIPCKGAEKAELAALRHALCDTVLTSAPEIVDFDLPSRDTEAAYLEGVADWHAVITETWASLIARHRPEGGRVALMVWGDPALYDSSLRIAERLRAAGLALSVRVVPGITSVQLLAAAFAIPLNTLAAPFLVTTGRRLATDGWPVGVDTVVVMLDGSCAFRTLDPEGLTIYWGAYLGMAGELTLSGPLATASLEIVAARDAARAERGWIMDVYLLRRTS